MANPAQHNWPMVGLAHRALQEQVAVLFPVKRPTGSLYEYRWRFADGSCGAWQSTAGRPEISAPPAATGVEWRPVMASP